MKPAFALLASCALALAATACSEPAIDGDGWLLEAEDNQERFTLIQMQMRGFDQPMWEVGERYTRAFEALERGNFELAAYHWEKIGVTIENGIAKRPLRAPNARAMFLDTVQDEVLADIRSGDPRRAWEGFELGRAACASCHIAENVEFMNDQPMMELRAPE